MDLLIENPKYNMDILPDSPLFEILINLPPGDLKSICQSNKRFNQFPINNEYFWRNKITMETPIKYKYHNSWYLTYKHIKSIPVFINIDNSQIYGGTESLDGLYVNDNYKDLYCNYQKLPSTYINHYPGDNFETINNRVHDVCNKLSSNFVVIYFKNDIVLRVSSYPHNLSKTFQAGMIPNKILIFNDPFFINNFFSLCIWRRSVGIVYNLEYSCEIFRMVCKSMILQYPNVNIYKLIYAREHCLDDKFELELEL